MVRQGEQSLACAGILRIDAEQVPNRGVHGGTEHDIVPWARGPQEIIFQSLASPVVFYSTIQLHYGCDSRFNIHDFPPLQNPTRSSMSSPTSV
jgi:hypothetical protein